MEMYCKKVYQQTLKMEMKRDGEGDVQMERGLGRCKKMEITMGRWREKQAREMENATGN